jgi:hypothetical protein
LGTGIAPPTPPSTAGRSAQSTIAVDNSFTVGKPVLNRKKGTAKLPVALPGAGTLIAVGSGVVTVPVGGRGTVKLSVRAHGRNLRTLNSKGRVALKLTLTFVPVGGDPNVKTIGLGLRKAR